MRICPGPGSDPGHVYLEAVLKLAITYFKRILFSGGPLLEYKGFLDHNAFWIGAGPDLSVFFNPPFNGVGAEWG